MRSLANLSAFKWPLIFWQGEHCSCNWCRIQAFTGKA